MEIIDLVECVSWVTLPKVFLFFIFYFKYSFNIFIIDKSFIAQLTYFDISNGTIQDSNLSFILLMRCDIPESLKKQMKKRVGLINPKKSDSKMDFDLMFQGISDQRFYSFSSKFYSPNSKTLKIKWLLQIVHFTNSFLCNKLSLFYFVEQNSWANLSIKRLKGTGQ